MWNFFKGLDYLVDAKLLQDKVEKLEKENGELRNVIERMNRDYADQIKKKAEEASNCEFDIDFEQARIVSIERIVINGVEKTMFGCLLPDSNKLQGNWCFYCSREKHNQIVENFRKYKESRKVA